MSLKSENFPQPFSSIVPPGSLVSFVFPNNRGSA
jgi:hypothetical protein